VPIPENAYISNSDARVYIVDEKKYNAEKHYNNDKRTVIGKAVSKLEMYPNSEYRFRYPNIFNENCTEGDKMPAINIIIGPYVTMLAIGHNIGVYEILINTFGPQFANTIMDYALYSIVEHSDITKDFKPTMANYLLFSEETFGDTWLSGFLKNKITEYQVSNFKNAWVNKCIENGLKDVWLCIDGSNDDCDAKEVNLSELGHSKSGTSGSIVSYMWSVNSKDGTPHTYEVYRGGRVDSKTIRSLIMYLNSLGVTIKGIILDRGFSDEKTINLIREFEYPYVIMLKNNIYAHIEMIKYMEKN